ncbi:MAG: peptidoglycan bridge formation glycyltransferase FemA/FemB family protein [Bacteroidales bacterium]|nr:peptidoglycan bridge formation glycyltransferase FemA/FemB family protein [Bacteroidales bacterium]
MKNLNSGQFHFIPNGGWIYKKHTIIDCYKIDIPLNSRFECFTLPVLKDFGITYTNITKLYYTLIVDLNQTEEHIWLESMNYRRRRMIKKAHKNKISVKNVNSDLSTFYSLYLAANKIYGIGNLNYSFFEELIKSEHIKFIPLVAYNSGNPCGGLGLICDANYAIYWLGVTDHNSENLGQGDLLQWEAIKYSKSLGCKYYDLCYIEKERLPTIYIFKKGFSTTEVEVPYFLKKSFMFRLINRISKLK